MLESNFDNSHFNKLQDLPAIGQKKRFNNMKKRLSLIFNYTKADPDYADNRNSKGKLSPVFFTLTYPNNDAWFPNHITDFQRKISQYAKRNWGIKLRIIWVAETTRNGTIHYHLVTWIPRNKRLPKPSEPIIITYKNGNTREYPPLWPYRAKIEGVRRGVYGYMLKYISKGCTYGLKSLGVSKTITDSNGNKKTAFPRLFGVSGMPKEILIRIAYYSLPQYIREALLHVRIGDKVVRKKGYWQLVSKDKVTRDHCGYWSYNHPDLGIQIKNNFTKDSYKSSNGTFNIDYIFGKNWSIVPEYFEKNVYFPF